jgi:hypothetical protein
MEVIIVVDMDIADGQVLGIFQEVIPVHGVVQVVVHMQVPLVQALLLVAVLVAVLLVEVLLVAAVLAVEVVIKNQIIYAFL